MLTPSDARAIGREVADAIANQAERKRPGQDRTPRAFSRIHPTGIVNPAAPTIDLGASLGCLRYMRRTTPGHQVNCPPGYTLTLDPRYTAPNAALAVSFQGGSAWNEFTVLHPGDTLHVPEGFTRFWCFNADQQDQYFDLVNRPANANLGYCAFLVGHVPGVIPSFASKVPMGPAALIQHGVLAVYGGAFLDNNPHLGFNPGQLRAIRVTIVPRNAAGVALFGAARVYASLAAFYTPRAIRGAAGATPIFPADTQTIESGPYLTGATTAVVNEVQGWGSQRPTASQSNYLTFEVPRGQLAGNLALTRGFTDWQAVSRPAGGLATTDLYAFIEGVP